MFHIITFAAKAAYYGTVITRRYKNRKCLSKYRYVKDIVEQTHASHNCSIHSNCILDYELNTKNILIYGNRLYHSCINQSYLGLLLRVLYSTTYYENDDGHMLALRYHTSSSVDVERVYTAILYRELCKDIQDLREAVIQNLMKVSNTQYITLSKYLGKDVILTVLRSITLNSYRIQRRYTISTYDIEDIDLYTSHNTLSVVSLN
mgnify:CR=1 FL=1